MSNPELSIELQQALDESHGVVQGDSFILMKMEVFRELLGLDSPEELRRELQVAFDQADCGDLAEWNVEAFLEKMHQQQDAKAE